MDLKLIFGAPVSSFISYSVESLLFGQVNHIFEFEFCY